MNKKNNTRKKKILLPIIIVIILFVSILCNYISKKYDTIEYDFQTLAFDFTNDLSIYNDFDKECFMNYEEYNNFCDKWNISKKYNDENITYAIYSYHFRGMKDIKITDIRFTQSVIKIKARSENFGAVGDISGLVIFVPINENKYTDIEYIEKYHHSYNDTLN